MLLVAFLVWVLLLRGGDDSVAEPGGGPVSSSQEDIAALADEVGHPIYWAGQQDGAELEVTRTENGQIYVRYLTDGAEVGDPASDFLTVGTYPMDDVQASQDQLAEEQGALTNRTPDGDEIVTNRQQASSAYIGFPDEGVQVEVYDPNPGRAFDLATSGEIIPVQ